MNGGALDNEEKLPNEANKKARRTNEAIWHIRGNIARAIAWEYMFAVVLVWACPAL